MVTKEEAQEFNCSRGDAEEGEISKSTDRSVGSIVQALSKVYAKFRSLGVQVFRLHSDREKSFMARPVQRWCHTRDLLQSMTGGDDAKRNGRVESEVQQIKRRTRLLLHESGLPHTFWVCALRHAAEQRLRAQLHRLGVITHPMLRFASTMSVKTKRWHRSGQLSNPFRSVQILGPSPFMPNGSLARDRRGMVQHVRSAFGSSRRRRPSTTQTTNGRCRSASACATASTWKTTPCGGGSPGRCGRCTIPPCFVYNAGWGGESFGF